MLIKILFTVVIVFSVSLPASEFVREWRGNPWAVWLSVLLVAAASLLIASVWTT